MARKKKQRAASAHVAKEKRIGRPTKPPAEGERVSLGLRVTADVKRKLEGAAIKKGRSISQEAEFRLEMSLSSDRQLILAYGGYWLPVIRSGGDLLVALPISWEEESSIDKDLVPLKIAEDDLKRIRNFFAGTPPPYDMSWSELNQFDKETSHLEIDE